MTDPVGVTPATGSDQVQDAAIWSGSISSQDVVVCASTAGFAGGSFQVTASGTGSTITFEQSNDSINWITLPINQIGTASGTGSPVSTVNGTGIWGYVSPAAYVRARVSAYNSGAVTIVLAQKRGVAPFVGISLSGSSSIIGMVNTSIGWADSIVALGASAPFLGLMRGTTGVTPYSFFTAFAYSDQAGTLFIDWTCNAGATWEILSTVAVAAMTTQFLKVPIPAFSANVALRVRYNNGVTAQGVMRLASSFTAG